MKSLSNRVKDCLERLGYEFNHAGRFSVEMTNNAVIVSEKIDLSQLTKNRDNANILLYLHEPRIGGPMQANRLSVIVNRHPVSNIFKKPSPSITLIKKEYQADNIPTKSVVLEMISEKLNISNNKIIELLNKKESQFQEHKVLYKPFIR